MDILGSTPKTITTEVEEGLIRPTLLKKSIAAPQSIIDSFFSIDRYCSDIFYVNSLPFDATKKVHVAKSI